jgi:menaquinol-cytochrome c reductase iron-sulfur subunit
MSEGASRRGLLMKAAVAANGLVGALLAVPVVSYLLSPVVRRNRGQKSSWVSLGPLSDFPENETRLATFRNPEIRPWDGQTAELPCWVRHVGDDRFQVFAINCAHLGCPVRWFPQSELFMCPCHGGTYYADGSRASGPPERGLFEYHYKIEGGQLLIEATGIPTMATEARLRSEGHRPCSG